MRKALRAKEEGAALVEFALVAPVLLVMVFGMLYGMLWAAAELSLSHAVSEASRFAVIADPASGTYPALSEVEDKLYSSTPFFARVPNQPPPCSISVTGDPRPNSPVTLSAVCDFPNPAGSAARAIGNLFAQTPADPLAASVSISAAAERNRE